MVACAWGLVAKRRRRRSLEASNLPPPDFSEEPLPCNQTKEVGVHSRCVAPVGEEQAGVFCVVEHETHRWGRHMDLGEGAKVSDTRSRRTRLPRSPAARSERRDSPATWSVAGILGDAIQIIFCGQSSRRSSFLRQAMHVTKAVPS